EHGLRDALGVVVPLHEERLQRREERELGGPLGPAARAVPAELAGAHGEPDEDHVAQVEGLEERVEVGGEGVVVVPGADLARRAEPATVVRDDAVPRVDELALLELPAVPVERVAVDEDDRLTGALVLVVELDVGGVLLPDGDVPHGRAPFVAAERTVVLSVVATLENDGSPRKGGLSDRR